MNPCIIIKLRMKSQPNLVLILHADNFAVILGEHMYIILAESSIAST